MVSLRWLLLLPAGLAAAAVAATVSLAAAQKPPRSVAQPTISGSATVGSLVVASPGAWTGTAPISLTYQWQRCTASSGSCAGISAATATSYSPQTADIGKALRVEVTARNNRGKATAYSRPTAQVTPPGSSQTLPTASWTGGFETGDISEWDNSFQYEPGRFTVLTSDGSVTPREGRYMGRVEVRSGDSVWPGGEVSQVYRYANIPTHVDHLGDDRYYGFSLYLPGGFPHKPNTLFNAFFELHGDSGGQAPFKIDLNAIINSSNPTPGFAAELETGNSPTDPQQIAWRLGDVIYDAWADFVIHIVWKDDSTGVLEVWMNGQKVVNEHGRQTWFTNGITNVKPQLGYYRGVYPETAVCYVDAMKIGNSYESVSP